MINSSDSLLQFEFLLNSDKTFQVGSVIMVNHGSESEDDEPLSKRICEDQVTVFLS